jgi:hypothetical protein
MPIPELDKNGLLPCGVHSCSLAEIAARFTWNQHRKMLFHQFHNFLSVELLPCFPDPVFFDGSFVTDKETPSDTDVVLDLCHAPDARKWQGLQYMATHQDRIMDYYGVHFWVNLPASSDFVSFFQYVGTKTACSRGLEPKHQKGILRIL